MRRIYITLGKRVEQEGIDTEDIGDIIVVDYDGWSVLSKISISGRNNVLHGRSRGTSGIDWFNEYIYVATRTDLVALNPNTLGEDHRINMGPPWAIHQIKAHNNQLHVTCVDRNMKQVIEGRFVVDVVPTKHSGIADNNRPVGSFNAISWDKSGDEYHMYTSSGEIYNFTKREKSVSLGYNVAAHDICFINDKEVLFTKSATGELVKCGLDSLIQETVYKTDISYLESSNIKGFMRGVAHSGSLNSVFVCSGPGTLHELDGGSFSLKRKLALVEDSETLSRECPFDILLDPRDWGERGKGSF